MRGLLASVRYSIYLQTYIQCVLDAKEQLAKENEELKQQREELEVRMSALKSQYEGRLSRQERELRDLREQQERHGDQKDEAQESGQSKVQHYKCPLYKFM